MTEKKQTNAPESTLFSGASVYVAIALACVTTYTFIDTTTPDFNIFDVAFGFYVFIFMSLGVLFTLYFKHLLKFTEGVYCITFLGVALRLLYVLYTPVVVRQHDVGWIDEPGHLGYIYYLFQHWQLPESNYGQFYHPPLHHFLSAVSLKISTVLGFSLLRGLEALQLLTCFYSACTLIVSFKILSFFNMEKKFFLLLYGIVAVHPTFLILSGSINNDMLAIFLVHVVLLYALRWQAHPGVKNTMILALAMGLAMMSKVSSVLVAAGVAYIFLQKWWENKKDLALYGKFLLFGVISIPLGMWYAVRNLLLFQQAFGYVLPLSKDSDIYTGQYSIVQRFLPVEGLAFFKTPYAMPFEDYNLISYTLKCATFGEYQYDVNATESAWVLLFVSSVLMLMAFCSTLYVMTQYKRIQNKTNFWFFAIVWGVQVSSFVYFYYQYPFGCTMDFRYIVPTIVCGLYFLAEARQLCGKESPWAVYYHVGVNGFILSFCLASIWMYALII